MQRGTTFSFHRKSKYGESRVTRDIHGEEVDDPRNASHEGAANTIRRILSFIPSP